MQALDFKYFVDLFVAHAPTILLVLLLFLFCTFIISQWRERVQIKQMQHFLSPNQPDILMHTPRLKVRTISAIKPAEQQAEKQTQNVEKMRHSASAKTPDLPRQHSSIDAEFEALRRDVEARFNARKKN